MTLTGCNDHSCVVQKPRGRGTNSGCRCPRWKAEMRIMELSTALRRIVEIEDGEGMGGLDWPDAMDDARNLLNEMELGDEQ